MPGPWNDTSAFTPTLPVSRRRPIAVARSTSSLRVERIKYLVHDRDNRYCAVFYGVFTA
jgi:hypothetical protein